MELLNYIMTAAYQLIEQGVRVKEGSGNLLALVAVAIQRNAPSLKC
jgi:hypothetical protein